MFWAVMARSSALWTRTASPGTAVRRMACISARAWEWSSGRIDEDVSTTTAMSAAGRAVPGRSMGPVVVGAAGRAGPVGFAGSGPAADAFAQLGG